MLVKKLNSAKSDELTKPNKLASNKSKENKETNDLPLATKKSTSCCLGTTPCSSTSLFSSTKKAKTKITIKYDVGFHNHLFIRGKGANLSWEKGLLLKNVKSDEWVWETDLPFTDGEFKVLINDQEYETGENHKFTQGTNSVCTPNF